MTPTAPSSPPKEPRPPRPPDVQGVAGTKRPYAPPRLTVVAVAGEVLDVLGPAQANYGGPGMP
jgi:hypothetical protein